MEARAHSEWRGRGGGADADAGPRGFQHARRGRAPVKAKRTYGEGAAEAGDGALRNLACMLSTSRRRAVSRAQAGFSRERETMGAAGEVRSAGRRRGGGAESDLCFLSVGLDRLCNGLLKNPTRPSSTISRLKFPFRTLVIIKGWFVYPMNYII